MRTGGGVLRCGLTVLAGSALVACAGTGAPQPQPQPFDALPPGLVELEPVPDRPPTPPEPLPDEVVEQLALPPVSTEMLTAMDRLRAAAGDSRDFGRPEISLDRTRVVVRWYGDVPDAVQAVVDEYAEGAFTIVVEPTRFRPGDLRAEAERLIREHPGVVVGVGARPAGDGIDLMVDTAVAEAAGGADAALEERGVVSRFPLFPRAGNVVPA